MAAEEVLLNLFDSCWFEHEILSKKSPSSQPQEARNPSFQVDQSAQEEEETEELPIVPNLSRLPTLKVRSLSCDLPLNTKTSLFSEYSSFSSPHSVFMSTTPKLLTVFSGEEEVIEFSKQSVLQEKVPAQTRRVQLSERKRSRKRVGPSKSMSELEFDELKGFMDLGFVFTEEDKDSILGSIIPGLQRLGSIGELQADRDEEDHHQRNKNIEDHPSSSTDDHVASRPYLSEAWDVLDQRKKEKQLMDWRIPANYSGNKGMKHHLKFWAHTVASTVR